MKKSGLTVFFLILFALAGAVWAQDNTRGFPMDGIILGEGVKMRSEATTRSEIVAELPFAAYVRILGKSEQSQQIGQNTLRFFWAHIELTDGRRGWVFGRYVNSLTAYNKDKCVFRAPDGQCFQWFGTRYTFTDFVDGDLEIMDNQLYVFRSTNDPYRFYPVRNVRTFDQAFAFDGHWHSRLNCCMIVDTLAAYRQVGNELEIIWREGIDDDFDEIEYIISFEDGIFQLNWGRSLARHYLDWARNEMVVEPY